MRELVTDADVLIENFKVGKLAAYGLDYVSLSALNPPLVYCSITGFGQDGPYAARAGYDFIVQGMSGIMDLTGAPDGQPQKIGVAFAYIMTGLQAALAQRERTGRGQQIDMALFDVMVGVPAGPINNVAQAFADPQILYRGLALALDRGDGSPTLPGLRTPIRFSNAKLVLDLPSPLLKPMSQSR